MSLTLISDDEIVNGSGRTFCITFPFLANTGLKFAMTEREKRDALGGHQVKDESGGEV